MIREQEERLPGAGDQEQEERTPGNVEQGAGGCQKPGARDQGTGGEGAGGR